MKKKEYEKPTMEIVEAQQEQQLLGSSESTTATMDGTFEEEDW